MKISLAGIGSLGLSKAVLLSQHNEGHFSGTRGSVQETENEFMLIG